MDTPHTEDRIAELEEWVVKKDYTFDAIWACINQLTKLTMTMRGAVGELLEIQVEGEESKVGGETQAEVDIRQMKRLLVVLSKKADLFGDDDFAWVFEEADDDAR